MKIKIMVLGCLMGVVVLSVGYAYGWGKPKEEEVVIPAPKIGIVSVKKIFQNCQRNIKYREEARAEQDRILVELQQLDAEIRAAETGLETRKPESADYLQLAKELAQKRASLPVQQRFYEQQLALKDQKWTEQLYKDILQETNAVARQKGLDLVFENDEPEFPAPTANELMLTIRTHKLLYSGGCLDITDEVIARLDAED